MRHTTVYVGSRRKDQAAFSYERGGKYVVFHLEKGSANFFSKGPASEYVLLCGWAELQY